jgi:hypothetical protein
MEGSRCLMLREARHLYSGFCRPSRLAKRRFFAIAFDMAAPFRIIEGTATISEAEPNLICLNPMEPSNSPLT